MTRHRSPHATGHPSRTVERGVTAALVLALVAGLAWIGGMIVTVLGWPL